MYVHIFQNVFLSKLLKIAFSNFGIHAGLSYKKHCKIWTSADFDGFFLKLAKTAYGAS